MPRYGHIADVFLTNIYNRLAETLPRIISREGTITHFNVSATSDLITPPTGKAISVLAFFFYSNADITVELRFKTSGKVVAGLAQKGAVGMNLIGLTPPTGEVNEILEIYLSGTGSVKGWVCWK